MRGRGGAAGIGGGGGVCGHTTHTADGLPPTSMNGLVGSVDAFVTAQPYGPQLRPPSAEDRIAIPPIEQSQPESLCGCA